MLWRRVTTLACVLFVLTAVIVMGAAGSAWAAPGAGWEITQRAAPTNLPPGGRGLIYLNVFNVGAASTQAGKPITVTDVLPEGITASYAGSIRRNHPQWECTGTSVVRCTNNPVTLPVFAGGGGVPDGFPIENPFPTPQIVLEVTVAAGPSRTLINEAVVAGGGAPTSASTTSMLHIGSAPAGFGVGDWDGWFSNEDGTLDARAGSHPYAATFELEVNSEFAGQAGTEGAPEGSSFKPAGGELRDAIVGLPPGFVGNPTAVPQCPRNLFDANGFDIVSCPPATVVGVAATESGLGIVTEPVYNLVPPPGVAAQFAFAFVNNPDFLDASVRTGSDYGITTHADNAPQGRKALGAIITLWGTPGDPSHNKWRCPNAEQQALSGGCPSGAGEAPFLTLPTACGAPQPFTVKVTQWQDPSVMREASFLSHDANQQPVGFTGCEDLAFGPAISTAPDTVKADTPAGLTVEVTPPVGGLTTANGLSSSDIQNTTVTLPEGLVINPGQAAGLQACGPAEDGLTTEAEKQRGEEDDGPPSCPNASKVGTVTIKSPLIEGGTEKQFEGSVYVLQSNPPEIRLLVAASADGVNLKLVGVVHLCEAAGQVIAGDSCAAPGQLITSFRGTPELPFTVFKLSFSGGAQAALDTPTQCGTYTTSADFSPWSSPFISDILTSAQFAITGGAGGGPCPSDPMPFSPSLTAGSTTDQAGGFTGFSLLLQRGDGQQRIEKLQFKEPAGLAGLISQVPLCPEPQAAQGTCPPASHIGHTVVASGPGPYPLVLPQPGDPELPIYLTGPYAGAPFGLSIVTPVIAGPFNLGTIVTRAKIEVDPHTAQITITTDPLPQIVAGVPTDLRSIDAVIDRSGFLFNPTNCTPASFTGTATSAQGAQAAISSPFGVGSCQSLKFTPKFSVSTSGKTSKADGASLTAKVSEPSGSMGSQANIAKVKVELPKQLPSRLTTLQKACTNAQFELNPANCPSESKIGYAKVITPVLPVPLEGPAIFVSHGGEAFPTLTMVLQGYGVTIDLVGTTFISKAGVTSTTFKTVPDTPFNTFELTLPTGKYSALTANANLCTQKLTMPTEFIAQNGAVINQSTPISVSGCKPVIRVKSHKVRGNSAAITVSVPAAGKLVATGKGLSKGSGKTSKAGTVTVKSTLTSSEIAVLEKHRGRKLKVAITLVFTPRHGAKLKTTTTVVIG